MLDVNFTSELTAKKDLELAVTPKLAIFSEDPVGNRPLLIFKIEKQTVTFTPKILVDPEIVASAKQSAKALSTAASTVGFAGLAATLVGISLQLPIMGYFIKFILILKIINRFKFMNIDFGPILGVFLDGIFNMFEVGDQKIDQ